MIYVNRYGRTEKGPALLVELAELLNAPVVDGRFRMNFPSRHKFNHSGRREQVLSQADVILALEPHDLWGLTNEVRDLIGRPNSQLNRQANLKIIHIGTESLMVRANYAELQRYAAVDISLPGDAEASMPALLEALKRELTPAPHRCACKRAVSGSRRWRRVCSNRRARMPSTAGTRARSRSRDCAWSSTRTCARCDWTLPTETVFLTDWPHRLWNIDKPHNWIGGSGAQGVGYNAPAALGAALANKGTGRITAAIVGDGELMMTNQTLWTAAKYQIPILYLVHNNRAYHMEIMHTRAHGDAPQPRRQPDAARLRYQHSQHRLRHAGEIDGRLWPRADRQSERSRAGDPPRDRRGQARRARADRRRLAAALRRDG